MKAWIEELNGKYYGTIVAFEHGKSKGGIEVWFNSDYRPSARQLVNWGMTEKEAQEEQMTCDGHFESSDGYLIAEAVRDALVKIKLPVAGETK